MIYHLIGCLHERHRRRYVGKTLNKTVIVIDGNGMLTKTT